MIFAVVLSLCSLFPIQGWATEAVPVSPAVERGEAFVDTCRPCFSWSQAEEACSYEVAVFGHSKGDAYSYEEVEAIEEPLIRKVIEAPAFSWTPSTENWLKTGMKYVWFVRGIDLGGQGVWSKGQVFVVDTGIAFAGMKEEVDSSIQEYLSEDPLITEIVNETVERAQGEVSSGVIQSVSCYDSIYCSKSDAAVKVVNSGTGSAIQGESSNAEGWGIYGRNIHSDDGYAGYFDGNVNTTEEYRINGFGVLWADENNISLGKDAGKSNPGSRNTFIGPAAGLSHTDGIYNTFVGHSAGHNSTGDFADSNTFVGAEAGYSNSGYWNIFLGNLAGHENTSGSANTYVGMNAGYSCNKEGNSNVFIGTKAGYAETGSHKLYIANT